MLRLRLAGIRQWVDYRGWRGCWMGLVVAVLTLAVSAQSMWAFDTNPVEARWTSGQGNWFIASHWSTGEVPDGTTAVEIGRDWEVLSVEIDQPGAIAYSLDLSDRLGGASIDIKEGGTLDVLAGGARIGQFVVGITELFANSRMSVAGTTEIGTYGHGTLILGEGSRFETNQPIILGVATESTGTIVIRGDTAGVIDAPAIQSGDGTATVDFNHTDLDYWFTHDGTADGDAV
ncbi:hypothetical protein ACERK3_18110, partial [Phycisphaerales bacterium AB-hyl4]